MHDVLDIIKNVQSLYAVGPTLSILKDFERVVDELDVYVFQNWEDGELLSGPVDSRHFVTCSFMWPADKMPDPAGGKIDAHDIWVVEIKMPKALIGNFKHGKDEIEGQDEQAQASGDLSSLDDIS